MTRSAEIRGAALRVALLGAFPFPHVQGSQVFAGQQAHALAAAGARVTLLCYGSGTAAAPPELDVVRIPRALSPRSLAAGPDPAKTIADAALVLAYVAAHRSRRFDVALAHNAEAAGAALAARPFLGVPVVYVAHTLLGVELATFARPALGAPLAALGRAVDRALAARADAVITLSEHAAARLRAAARGPVHVIPPGLDPSAAPDAETVAKTCARSGIEAGRFALYAGNLDGYQNLALLAAAARAAPDVCFVVASHAAPDVCFVVASHAAPAAAPERGLRYLRVDAPETVAALTAGAGALLLPRRATGGFPVKLLNYMAASRAIVAHAEVAEGLVHDRSAWLLPATATPRDWANAVRTLLADPARAARLGAGARAVLEARHRWPALAARTLAVVAAAARS